MSSSLNVTKVEDENQVEFRLNGQIDEDADLSQLKTDKEKVIFDLEEVSLINSCGIRDWVEYQNSLPGNSQIIYRKCPQVIVEQLNIDKKTQQFVDDIIQRVNMRMQEDRERFENVVPSEEVADLINKSKGVGMKDLNSKKDAR